MDHRVEHHLYRQLICTSSDVGYCYYLKDAQLSYIKTVDQGVTWGKPITVASSVASFLGIWYSRWDSDVVGTLIQVRFSHLEAQGNYRRLLDTVDDSLSEEEEQEV